MLLEPLGPGRQVEMQSGIVSGIYRNPRHELDFADMFVAHLQALRRYSNWMAIGDRNLTPDEGDIHCLFPMDHVIHFPRETNGFPKSTRWKGSCCIDWCASAPSFCPESIQLDDTYWSDHIMLKLTIQLQRYDMPAVVDTLDCSRPRDMPLDEWAAACTKLWDNDKSTHLVPRRFDEIQQCWDNFNKKLEKVRQQKQKWPNPTERFMPHFRFHKKASLSANYSSGHFSGEEVSKIIG